MTSPTTQPTPDDGDVTTVAPQPEGGDAPEGPAVAEGQAVGTFIVSCMGILFVGLALVVLYVLIKVWPEPGSTTVDVALFWQAVRLTLSGEQRLILIVLLSGALGSYIHAATSLVTFVGNRQLKRSWLLWYLLRPFIGMALALTVYFLFRGGLVSGSAGDTAINPYGAAAVGALSGMFSKQAVDKLKEVFDNLFAARQEEVKRTDKLGPQPAVAPVGVSEGRPDARS